MPSIVFPDDLAPWISSLFEICQELRKQADDLSRLTAPVTIESIHEIDHHVGMLLQRAFELGCFGRLHEWDLELLGRVIAQGDARSFSCHLRCQIFPVNDREYRNQFATVEAEQVAEYRRLADEVYAYGCRLNNWSQVRAELLNAERDVEPILRRNDLRERITKSQAEALRTHLATRWLKCEPQESQRELGKEYHPYCGYTRLEDGSHDPVLLDRHAVWDRVYNRKVKAALLGAAEVAGLGNISKELLDNSVLRDSHEWDRFVAAAERDDAAEQRARPAPTATELRSLADRLRKLAKAIFQSGKWDTPFVKDECATIPHPLVTGWFTRANAQQDKEQKRLFETVCSLLGKIYSGGVIESPHERLESLAKDVDALAVTLEPQFATAETVDDSKVAAAATLPPRRKQSGNEWLHHDGSEPPQDYYGEKWLTGTQTEIGFAIRHANLKPVESVVALRDHLKRIAIAEKARVWCRATTTTQIAVFLRDAKAFHGAEIRLVEYRKGKSKKVKVSQRKSVPRNPR